ncbi:heterokaryon incompatibility protein-domain-containing protein [Cercophora scortea]|uniref:Heterokaryon incompatibility protein-domain-containing protein n=1 Tax=Cercophora scortea TaxID=314031 RepID=A0AAE0M4N5_9PEZI|nr:heterokaryon incompatibility protein-domain-containing protein [Cercophora scortea]
MRLINATTLELDFFYGDDIPRYAILSHTWGKEEVTFQDWQSLESAKTKAGFTKIEGACRQAIRDGLEYVWVDTNCIDKSSSSELSEAINSMFAWYRNSQRCYVHLADVTESPLESRWFGRGWTLQELLAPGRCFFYGADWDFLGTKEALAPFISEATSIESKFILGTARIDSASISKRMSWVSKRKTTRTEDIAYCMLGIFNINMPMLYGEGTRAFLRLQEELIKISADQTIFCWEWGSGMPPSWCSILAPSPAEFANCSGFSPKLSSFAGEITPYVLTNVGMTMTAPYTRGQRCRLMVLSDCSPRPNFPRQ